MLVQLECRRLRGCGSATFRCRQIGWFYEDSNATGEVMTVNADGGLIRRSTRRSGRACAALTVGRPSPRERSSRFPWPATGRLFGTIRTVRAPCSTGPSTEESRPGNAVILECRRDARSATARPARGRWSGSAVGEPSAGVGRRPFSPALCRAVWCASGQVAHRAASARASAATWPRTAASNAPSATRTTKSAREHLPAQSRPAQVEG